MKPRYRKMLDGMARNDAAGPPNWSVYVLRCADGTLYTGVAKDPKARLQKHNAGRGAAYTRTRRPARLVYREDGLTRSGALIREAEIKAFPRSKKLKLAKSNGKSSCRKRSRI